MQRELVTPADLSGAALAELKDWLAITTARDDASLIQLLAASLATCSAFTRQVALEATYEEIHDATTSWQNLGLLPIRAITQVEAVAQDGGKTPLAGDHYLLDITTAGLGRFRLLTTIAQPRVALRFSAGLAADWTSLEAALRHGVLRLAAHHFRARETDLGAPVPPSAIAALWQPFRRIRLA